MKKDGTVILFCTVFLIVYSWKYFIKITTLMNSYGHPHEELLQRLYDIGSDVVITYESGDIPKGTLNSIMKQAGLK